MLPLSLPLTAATAQAATDPSTVLGTIWLALVCLGILGIFVAGFTAKKINNIHNPTYSKAFLAQFLIGLFSLAGIFVFGLYLHAPTPVAIGLSLTVIPVAIYRVVFGSMWTEALIIWFVTTTVQGGVGWGLMLAGLIGLAGTA